MARAIPKKLRQLAAAFIAQYPIYPGHPSQSHVNLSSADLDTFGIAEGVYKPTATSVDDLDTERGKMVARLNTAGVAESWCAESIGFQVEVYTRIKGVPTIWQVKPVEVAAAHNAITLVERNRKTIGNRAKKIDKMYTAIDPKQLSKAEAKALDNLRTANIAVSKLQITLSSNHAAMIAKETNALKRKDPKHRLLPK